jgi:hypothetical protein
MGYRVLAITLCITFLLTGSGFAADRDADARDLRGIPKSHRYAWAVVGGTAIGAGLGVIAPGGTKSAFKGALLGGSVTSAFYLAKNPRAARGSRQWAHIVTNTVLGTSLLWTLCNCSGGAWAGGLIGGGGTAVFQAMGTHDRRVATWTGSNVQPGNGSQPVTSSPSSQPVPDTQQPSGQNHDSSGTQNQDSAGKKKPANDAARLEPKKPPQWNYAPLLF